MVSRGATQVVLLPRYFDASLSRAQGRRVPEDIAVDRPDAKWVHVAAQRAGFDCELDEAAADPSTPTENKGRVLVAKSEGVGKEAVLRKVATEMRASADKRA